MRATELSALVLLGAIWGSSFLFIKVAVPALGPFVLMELRVGLAAIALTPFALVVAFLPALRSRWRQFLILGTLNAAIPFTLIATAEITLTSSLAAILNSTTPLFAAVVSAAWIGETLTVGKIIGLVTGIVGVATLVGLDPVPLSGIALASVGIMLVAALAYALGGVYAKRTFVGVPSLSMAAGQQTAAAIALLPFAAGTLPGEPPSLAVVLSVLGLALLCTAVAYLLYFYLIANVGPTKALTVTFLVPVFGLLFGVFLLNEPFGLGTFVGFVIILVSVALVTGLPFGGERETKAMKEAGRA
jgi:drug/metabolite transporter (DMT)-like permease